jgi:GrpB-like predicted nucleotidyltransferase (UPF0157 family)
MPPIKGMRETIQIVAYDPGWVHAFEKERDRIRGALGELARRIDHNGSTSVPDLAAKPIIDIQVSVARLQPIDAFAPALFGLGYQHLPHPDDAFCPFFHRPKQWPHTHHVHVVEAGGVEERRTLAFRDYLREHSEVAREYETLKRELAATHSAQALSTQQSYADAKGAFIERAVEAALRAGYPRCL